MRICRANRPGTSQPASPLTSGKNVGHSGHLSQAMTHNVQLHVGELGYRALAAPERENADRVGDVGRTQRLPIWRTDATPVKRKPHGKSRAGSGLGS